MRHCDSIDKTSFFSSLLRSLYAARNILHRHHINTRQANGNGRAVELIPSEFSGARSRLSGDPRGTDGEEQAGQPPGGINLEDVNALLGSAAERLSGDHQQLLGTIWGISRDAGHFLQCVF